MNQNKQEIERKYRLKGFPKIPFDLPFEVWMILQGYSNGVRFRRICFPDGTVRYYRTHKSGQGLIRNENEHEISKETFENEWNNVTKELSKVRFRFQSDSFIYELDKFENISPTLYLLEVELKDKNQRVVLPSWICEVLQYEVTGDSVYYNENLAR